MELLNSRMSLLGSDYGTGSTGLMSDPSDSFRSFGNRFPEQAYSARYEYAALFAAISAIGVTNWDWGNSGFRFNNEGWFNEENTASGGMDKLGHAFTGYLMSDMLTWAIRNHSKDPRRGEISGALLSFSLMTYIDVLDGFSSDHGFSYEDLLMSAAGASFSALRNSFPELKEKVDFRMQYLPSRYSSFEPLGDYEGQKYFLILKLAGFESLRNTPLKYVELHGGYYARGYSREERAANAKREQNLYVGIGVNLSELLFGEKSSKDHWSEKAGRTTLEYIQIPYTYASAGGTSGR